jgi:MerR family redox-sensitive transcriptional activator SoxR
MKELSIGELAKEVGINASAIRYYERIGLLPKSRRVNGQRRYDAPMIQQLRLIIFAQEVGFNLEEIETLFYGFESTTPPSERWQILARQKLVEIRQMMERGRMMERLLENVLHCGCLRLEDCYPITDAEIAAEGNPNACSRQ